MQYEGELYGKIGKRYIPLTLTSADVDAALAELKHLAHLLDAHFDRGGTVPGIGTTNKARQILSIAEHSKRHPDPPTDETKIEDLLKDKQRLDYLDDCNAALNAKSGTLYAWHMIQTHNVNRLMLDLHDSNAVGCHPTGMLSVRQAIDAVMKPVTDESSKQELMVNEHLMEWGRHWILDGDLVRCKKCNRAIVYSRRHEKLNHHADCPQHVAYPWETLIALSPAKNVKSDS